ncbi:MAG: DUF503 domain-containing protein [Clostridia bacterium]|nr:MAG: DUF503 domain-containing protein [Clostridia bacterium]
MLVGVCTIRLHLPEAGSLKDKRRVIKSMLDRIHSRFNVSIAEVEDQDVWQVATLGVAVVSNGEAHIHEVLAAVVNAVDGYRQVEMLEYQVQIV